MIERFLAWDGRVSARLRVAEKPGWRRTLAATIARSGDSWFWILGLALVWLGFPTCRERALILGAGILVTAVIVMALKFTIRRRRPEGEWGGVYRATDPHSFPSGHAARALMLAVLSIGLGPPWFAILLCIWAPLVGLARVSMGVHYLSDVLAGWVIGGMMGAIIFQFV